MKSSMQMTLIKKEQIEQWLKGLQDRICATIEAADGEGTFKEDSWQREGGGGGRSRVIEGKLIEKGGVNFSAVHGSLPEKIATGLGLADDNATFYATGVSIVLHPKSPMVPIIHMNVRYFEMSNGNWWFGGGIDLTPHYIVPEDAAFFHNYLKDTCDAFHPSYYDKFKEWADNYFFIRHRNETRGVGGIFYDRLGGNDGFTKEARFEFMKAVGNAFCPIYTTLLEKNKDLPYGEKEEEWQRIRRSRYVEFNLVWDRGTKFGLETNGRIESILMSMPPMASWVYNHQPEEGGREAQTLSFLKKGIDWADL